MTDIEEVYNNHLYPILEQYEPKRKQVFKKSIRYTVLTAILGLIIGLLIIIFTNERDGMIPIALTVFPAIGVYVLFGHFLNRGLAQNISEECLSKLLEKREIPFEPASSLEANVRQDLVKSQFTQKRIDSFRTEQHLKAKTGSEGDYLCYAEAKKKLRHANSDSSGTNRRFETTYSGLLGRVKLEGHDDFHLFLRPKDVNVAFDKGSTKEERMSQVIQKASAFAQKLVMRWDPDKANIDGLQSIQTQDRDFDDHFEVYANDREKALQFLDQERREYLLVMKVRGTRYQKDIANSLTHALLSGGQLPELRQPYFFLSLRGDYAYWGRTVDNDWLPVKLENSLIQPDKWKAVLMDLEDVQQLSQVLVGRH